MERRIDILKDAYDRRDEGYGVGGVQLRFSLVGLNGAISWSVLTDMHQPHLIQEWKQDGKRFESIGGAIVIHSVKPLPYMEDDEPARCDLIPDGQCYGDCGFLAGSDLYETWLYEGTERMWTVLEEWYYDNLGADKKP